MNPMAAIFQTGIRRRPFFLTAICLTAIFLSMADNVTAARIKDIVEIQGVRQNQLIGYGLVVGLKGTGDGNQALFTLQSISSMLEKMGMTVDPTKFQVKNVAAVMVTADMPPFARPGAQIDVTASSMGDATSLQGGTLLFTPLKGADGQVYAVAQGALLIGGFSASGAGASVQKNFPTVGRVVGGGLIERAVPSSFGKKGRLALTLNSPDFTTANRVARTINAAFSSHIASTVDSGTIDVDVPAQYVDNQVAFVANIESLDVTPDVVAKVVVNERTGTVVIGENVRISTVAIAHGNLSIQIKENPNVSQPMPFSQGQTVVTPNTNMKVKEGKEPIYLMKSGTSIGELVRALNALGVTPRDLISIFQALQAAGALQAQLEVM